MQCVRFFCFFLKIGNKLFSRGRVKIDAAAVRMRVVFTKTGFLATGVVGIIHGCPCISLDFHGCLQPSMDWHLGTKMVQNNVPGKERAQRGVHFTIGCWPRIV